jgi:methyl-accepting chemotaxis protein
MSWFSLGSKSASDKTAAPSATPGMGPGALLGAISTAVLALDAQFVVRSLNAAAEALVSRHPAQFGGMDALSLPGSRADILGPDVMNLLRAPQNLPMNLEWSAGDTICVLTLNALRTDGAITGYTIEFVDISTIAKKAREDSEELKVRTEIMDLTSIVSYADLKGDIVSVNEKFLEVSKYSRDELIGHGHNTTRHPDMPKEVFKEMWSTIGRGKVFRGMVKNRAKDGTPYYVDAVIAPFVGANGKPRKYLGVRYDITEAEIERQNMRGLFSAIDESYAYIEFDLNGNVLSANKNFLTTLGYQLTEIQGRHHRMFVDPAYAGTHAYTQFWSDLNAGMAKNDVFKRVHRSGTDIWIQAVYAPVKDEMGRVIKVVKIATDITAERLKAADSAGQLDAISKAQAVIEFDLSGRILSANENFCATLGYQLAEMKGQHHSMFAEPVYRASPEYRAFWEKLGRGEYDAGQYKRVAKSGKEIWIQASYNPILDLNGKPFKVVKYATDITAQIRASEVLQRAVQEVQEVVIATKDNDLTKRIPLGGKTGEIEQLCSGVNGLIDSMSGVIATISEAAGTITTAVGEITSGTDDLSRRTEKQASSLEETSASMEEIASTIRLNAENAQEANKLAVNARTLAASGGEIVTHAVVAMSRIEEGSTKVSDIIGVIDEIAFQTNLLALNAAVEAARAGDAGRGFAVVASEVRSLAQRSSEAAKDIKALIVQSGAQVKDGVKLVNDAGSSLGEIVDSVRRVTDIIAEIASASKEQAVGVEEINKAVSQMDEMTQQNSALVEENAAACRLLQDQAEDMANRMAAFRLDTEIVTLQTAAPRPAARKPAAPPARAPMRRAAGGGGAAALQADLAHAFADEEWKEF